MNKEMTRSLRSQISKALVLKHRADNPKSRAPGAIIYVQNGATRKQRGCILCGEGGPTWCGNYRQTKRARDWEYDHLDTCSAVSAVIQAGLENKSPAYFGMTP